MTNPSDSFFEYIQTAAARGVVIHSQSRQWIHQRVKVTPAVFTMTIPNARLAQKTLSFATLIQTKIANRQFTMLLSIAKHSFLAHFYLYILR